MFNAAEIVEVQAPTIIEESVTLSATDLKVVDTIVALKAEAEEADKAIFFSAPISEALDLPVLLPKTGAGLK